MRASVRIRRSPRSFLWGRRSRNHLAACGFSSGRVAVSGALTAVAEPHIFWLAHLIRTTRKRVVLRVVELVADGCGVTRCKSMQSSMRLLRIRFLSKMHCGVHRMSLDIAKAAS